MTRKHANTDNITRQSEHLRRIAREQHYWMVRLTVIIHGLKHNINYYRTVMRTIEQHAQHSEELRRILESIPPITPPPQIVFDYENKKIVSLPSKK